jgi:hypothetical protein
MKFSKIISLFIVLNFATTSVAQANVFVSGFEYLKKRFEQLDRTTVQTLSAIAVGATLFGSYYWYRKSYANKRIRPDASNIVFTINSDPKEKEQFNNSAYDGFFQNLKYLNRCATKSSPEAQARLRILQKK